MLKVMVVDDEPWGRRSVSKMIAELGLGVEVVSEARNGAEALALIPMARPDIVVTDMNMPVMDGGRFLERLYKEHNGIKTVVISGHSQFEYMKAAVAFQACEYVLKPVSYADLKSAMEKAVQACLSRQSQEQRSRLAHEMRRLRTETFLQNVAGRRIASEADIVAGSAELLSDPPVGRYRLAVCMLRGFRELAETKFHGNSDLLMYSVENMLNEVTSGAALYAFKSDDRQRLCLLLPDEGMDLQAARELLRPFHEAMVRVLGLGVVAGLSASRDRLAGLPEALAEAQERLGGNPLCGEGFQIRSEQEDRSPADGAELLTVFNAKLLQQAIAAGQPAAARRLLADFARKAELSRALTIHGAQRELRKLIDAAGSGWQAIAAASPFLASPGTVDGIASLASLLDYVARFCEAADSAAGEKPMGESSNAMREIVAYLDEHYFEDIGLIDIATRYHLDPSYLSRQFKAATGENFIEYVTRKRMEKACELLREPDRKINDIAELVGYENQRYFSQVFKKFTGATPTEYRESPVVVPRHAKN
ncbi:response regulator [Paenibacillus sp. LHD-117]|uniref:response regulator transcription factor n=1 Tax=Paenibacillus sp. LHD-117 TaxID=3071412 RepID=UPI0027E00443|nr:helix-turn-helix domain-containing protein [Paenibacillus sp. LHD-117]MDQ6421662.1 response regulator [Paenibacillus sp. LHD-117]